MNADTIKKTEILSVRKYVENFCREFGYPETATEEFLTVFDRIADSEDLSAKFFGEVMLYKKGGEQNLRKCVGKGSASEYVSNAIGINIYTTDFLFFLCLTPYLEKRYAEKGIDVAIFKNSMRDLSCKLDECVRLYGVNGSFVASWFAGFFDLSRFSLGRLQFEIKKLIFPLVFRCGGRWFLPGAPYINVHIPSLGPLKHDEVLYSYELAYDFFKKDFVSPEILFSTSSWLLFKEHPKMLPKTSNIIKFYNDYLIVQRFPIPNNTDFWRVFYRPYDKKHPNYSGETTLQKAYAKHLSSGKKMGGAIGVFLFDGENIINTKRR
jgi:hypothetical protein